ncbi:MAG: molybdopterin-dependent oxidoreductase, partial [Gammaproteobacteria bacterium]|nr:molybdopterin-dependent oxidoreductase [Gammaproteobacteria bacterium]
MTDTHPTSTHWGNYLVESDGEQLISVKTYDADKEPTAIGQSLLDAMDPRVRISQPMVRQGFFDNPDSEDRTGRGKEPFVAVSWDQALDLAAAALRKTFD